MANVVKIKVVAEDLASKTIKGVSQSTASMTDRLKAARLPLLAVTGALTGMGIVGVKAASDLDESLNKANVTFLESVGVVEEFSRTSARSFGISQAAALEYSGTLGTILNASGVARDASAGMSVELVKLAADLASFNNIPIDIALEKIRSGLVGEIEPLRTVGVLLNAAAVEAKAAELGIVGVDGALTEAQKVQARYALILEQTTNQQGDFQRTADSMANSLRIAQAQFSDVAATFGAELLPAATKLLSVVNGLLSFFKELPQPVKTATVVIAGITAGIAALGLAIPPLIAGFSALGVAVNFALGGIPIAVAAAVAGATLLILKWKEVVAFFKGAGGWILAAFGPIGLAAKLVIDHWDTVVAAVKRSVEFIVGAINKVIDGLNFLARQADRVAGVFGQNVGEISKITLDWGSTTEKVASEVAARYQFMGNTVEESNQAIAATTEKTAQAVAGANLGLFRSNMAVASSFQAVHAAAAGGQGLGTNPITGEVDLFPGVGTSQRAFLDQFFATGRTPQAGFNRNFAAPDTPISGGQEVSSVFNVYVDSRQADAIIEEVGGL